MVASSELQIVLKAKDEASKILGDVSKGLEQTQKSGMGLMETAKNVGIGMTAMGGTIVGALGFAVNAAMEAGKVETQLNAVLESTKGVAGLTAEAVKKMATEFQGLTKYSDEEIISAQNLLLTFTKLNKDIFPDATKIVLDMSTALGQDLKSSAIQVGKALQDPILGVTALRRVGVNFNKESQELIKNLVETGRIAEAQAYILKELQTEFGGSAEAAGKTFGGQLTILKNRLDDIGETIGKTIIPILKQFLDKLKPVVEWVEKFAAEHPELLKNIVLVAGAIGALMVVLGPLLIMLPGIIIAFQTASAVISLLVSPIGLVTLALIALGVGVYFVIKHWDEISAYTTSIWNNITTFLSKIWKNIVEYITEAWNKIKSITETIWNGISSYFKSVWDAITAPFKTAINFIVGLLEMGLNQMDTDVVSMLSAIKEFFISVWNDIKLAFITIWQGLVSFLTTTFETLKTMFTVFGTIISGIWSLIWGGIKDSFLRVWNAIKQIIEFFAPGIKAVWGAAKETILEAWNDIWEPIKTATNAAIDAIKKPIADLTNWIRAQFRWISSTVGGFVGGVVEKGKAITGFQRGGIVTKPTLGLVGETEPEAVIPLSRLQGIGAGLGISNVFNFDFTGAFIENKEKFIQEVTDRIGRSIKLKSQGV